MGIGVGGAAAIGAAGSIGGALLSKGKGSGGSGSGAGTQDTAPWGPQQGPIQNALTDAGTVYGQRLQQGAYGGEMVAPGNAGQNNAATAAENFNTGTGQNIAGQTGSLTSGLYSAASPYVNNAQDIARNGVAGPNAGLQSTLQGYGTGQQTISGANPQLSSALNQSAVSGANAMQGFQGNLMQAGEAGLSDPTQRVEGDAQSYANSPQVQASLAATNNAINQTLTQSTLPTMNQQQAAAGNLNSSRSGMAEGMARQAAATSEGQADASIENNAYNSGLSTAGSLYSSGLNTATSANMFGYNNAGNFANGQAGQQIGLNEANASNELSAANSGLNSNLAYEFDNANTQLSGNQQLGNAVTTGINAGNAAVGQASGNFALGSAAGTLQQQMQQTGDTNAYDQYQNSNQYGQQILQNYFGIVGAPLGTQGSSTTSQQLANPLNVGGALAGGVTAGVGLFKNLNQGNAGYGLFGSSGQRSSYGSVYGAAGSPFQSNGTAFNSGGVF